MNASKHLILLAALALCGTGASAQPPHGPGAGLPPEADLDGDGSITREELQSYRAAEFTAADLDGGGTLSLSELQAMAAARREARQADDFARLDQDGDGLVSEAEFVDGAPQTDAAVAARMYALAIGEAAGLAAEALATLLGPEGQALHEFAMLDTDGNGAVSQEEFLATPSGHGPGGQAGPPPFAR